MKKSVKSLLVLAALGVFTLAGHAQTATKVLVVDMAKLLDGHYKTQEQNDKLRGDGQKAQEELDRLNKEGNALVEQYKELVDQSNNPAATAEAKSKVQSEAQRKMEEIQRKTNEVRTFEANTQRALQGRIRTFRVPRLFRNVDQAGRAQRNLYVSAQYADRTTERSCSRHGDRQTRIHYNPSERAVYLFYQRGGPSRRRKYRYRQRLPNIGTGWSAVQHQHPAV